MSVGMKTYVKELVNRLPAVAPDLEFLAVSNAHFDEDRSNVKNLHISEAIAANGSFQEQSALPRMLWRTGASLVHYMSVYAPRRSRLPHVYTIHDLIHLRFPDQFSWKVPPYYRFVVRPVAASARSVITDSQATVGDLQAFLGVRPERVRVIPLGVADSFRLSDEHRTGQAARAVQSFALERPYFVYAGNHRAHKNLGTLIGAWRRLEAPCDLVITGEGAARPQLDATPKRSGRVLLTGHIRVEDLVSLYAGCVAAVQPSLYEGFGLSVLEAMAAGAPVIIARTPALVDVGGDCVLSFTPTDERGLASLMAAVLTDDRLAARLRDSGRERAMQYSWDLTARQTADVYREAVADVGSAKTKG